jgi:cytochrome c
MKTLRAVILVVIVSVLTLSVAAAMKNTAEERGKAYFNDPNFAGGTTACSSCHPDGKGLEKAAEKKTLTTPAGPARTLEEAINICIVNANKGRALDAKSREMRDVVAYIKSLGKKKPKTSGY